MNDRIRNLRAQMTVLEDELRTALHEQESSVLFQIKGKRIEFERSIRDAHRLLRTGVFRWLVVRRPRKNETHTLFRFPLRAGRPRR